MLGKRLSDLPEKPSLSIDKVGDFMKSEQRKEIQELVEILAAQNLTEIEVERKDLRIRIRREPASPQLSLPGVVTSPMPSHDPIQVEIKTPEINQSGFLAVTSPIVGTFYRSPSPDSDSYVEEGDVVHKGQVLCIVEAMKLMNEIESEYDGKIVKILVESASSVEYGQPLFLIDPATIA